MKTLVALIAFMSCCIAAKSEDALHLGLVSELSVMKNSAEQYLIRNKAVIGKDPNVTAYYEDAMNAIDQIILQMTSNMKEKNRLRLYRKLNSSIVGSSLDQISNNNNNRDVSMFLQALKTAHQKFKKLIEYKSQLGGAIADFDITAGVTGVAGILESIRDFREKKVDKICTVLDSLRWQKPEDLLKPKEDKPDEKDKKK